MSALELIDTVPHERPGYLLSDSVKTLKGLKVGVGTAVMYLAPAGMSGHQICALRTAGCEAACLHDSGMLRFRNAQAAQLKRTWYFFEHRAEFIGMLEREIAAHEAKCRRDGLRPAVRLNGTSDLKWEKLEPELFRTFRRVKFYDYTKVPNRRDLPANYSLTFSLAEGERSWAHHELALESMNVAVVLSGCGSSRWPKPFPKTWHGRKLIDGDTNDVRFADKPRSGAYVGLRPKGRAARDESGFVRSAFYV